jgi:CRP-like cAMP-binding protein
LVSTEALRRHPIFAAISEAQLNEVAKISHERVFKAGDRIFEEGSPATHFMLLETGEVHIVYRTGNCKEIIADTLGAGDPMAWFALLEPYRLIASGVAKVKGTLIAIETESLRRVGLVNTGFILVMMKEVAKLYRSRLSAMRV